MEQIDLFAETVNTAAMAPAKTAAATSPCSRHLSPFIGRTSGEATHEPFSQAVFLDDWSGLELTETQLLSRSSSSSLYCLGQQAIQATPMPGETLIVDCSATAWRVVTAWKNTSGQRLQDGEYFELASQKNGQPHVLHVSLYVPHPKKPDIYFLANSALHAAAHPQDVADILSSAYTEAALSSRMLPVIYGLLQPARL